LFALFQCVVAAILAAEVAVEVDQTIAVPRKSLAFTETVQWLNGWSSTSVAACHWLMV
jgi:hypothetical protein